MQFFLDDSAAAPIQLFSVSNAPQRRHHCAAAASREAPPAVARGDRCVPGYPYIRFASEDDYDGSYPFDAFQDLRSAYGASPLVEFQGQMRGLLQQRAQAHLRRELLEKQLRAHQQREHELLQQQLRLQQRRQEHARRAAESARAAYLSRLQKEEAQRQLESQRRARQQHEQQQAAFFPPFHFFEHILDSQIRSQDDAERRRAVKSAMADLLDTYFVDAAQTARSQPPVAQPTPRPVTQSTPVPAIQTSPPRGAPAKDAKGGTPAPRGRPQSTARDLYADPAELESVLRVVHDRLSEIAAEEDMEKAKQQQQSQQQQQQQQQRAAPAAPAAVGPSTPPQDKVNVDVIDEPASDAPPARAAAAAGPRASSPKKAGFEIEEPVDYARLAQALRSRVAGLDDERMFLPPSPPLSTADEEPAAAGEQEPPSQPMDADDGGQCSDSEFASLLDGCKEQLRDIQEAPATSRKRAARCRQRRNRRRRSNKSVVAGPADNAVVGGDAKQAALPLDETILGPKDEERNAAAQQALQQLRQIERELDQVRRNYSRQVSDTQLSFVADKNGGLRLAYNRGNSAFREYQEVLQRLLLSLDAIPSHGDEAVRAKRKAVVRKIQAILDALDQLVVDQESEISESTPTEVSSLAD